MSNEERIAVLELQYRTMKRIVLGVAWVISLNFAICALIIVGFVVSNTNAPDVIQAKKFEVVNDDGKPVVVIGSGAYGGSWRIDNNEGNPVAQIFSRAEGVVWAVSNKEGKPVVGINASASGGLLGVFDKDRKIVVGLYADTGGGSLAISNKDGERVALIRADADGNGVVNTLDNKGQTTSESP